MVCMTGRCQHTLYWLLVFTTCAYVALLSKVVVASIDCSWLSCVDTINVEHAENHILAVLCLARTSQINGAVFIASRYVIRNRDFADWRFSQRFTPIKSHTFTTISL